MANESEIKLKKFSPWTRQYTRFVITEIIIIIVLITSIGGFMHYKFKEKIVYKEKIIYKEKLVMPKSFYHIILNDEMKELSAYIKIRKSNQPKEICDSIAYHVITISKANNIPHDVTVGIIEIESMWNVYAKSKANAKGLMQVLIEDGIEIDPEKVYDIEYNITTGIKILKSKLNKSNGDISLALKYYVGGDDTYHEMVYKFLGKYVLYKMNIIQENLDEVK